MNWHEKENEYRMFSSNGPKAIADNGIDLYTTYMTTKFVPLITR